MLPTLDSGGFTESLEDGTLKLREDGVYSLTHLVMRLGKFKEYQITTILIIVEVIVCASSFVLVQYV